MATFYNQATLFYNGIARTSNTTTGEIIEALYMTKTAVSDGYSTNGTVTYVISIVNSGTTSFTNLTLTDDLGAYTFGGGTLTPLTYVDGSVKYYLDGVLQAPPTVVAGPPLTLSGISVPASSNAIIAYEASVNQFAPLGSEGAITNTATLTGTGIIAPVVANETVNTEDGPVLNIIKVLSPAVVSENGQITYTFTIENYGNTAATVADNVMVTDTFNPILNDISVSFNGTPWTSPAQYTYNTQTGEFATVAGEITVPAATYIQDAQTGVWTALPGVSVLTVVGTV